MAVTLNTVKLYCRVDDSTEDVLLQQLIDAADDYMASAINGWTVKRQANSEKWQYKADLAMMMLVAEWYERRLPAERPVSSAINMLITQLQLDEANETDNS